MTKEIANIKDMVLKDGYIYLVDGTSIKTYAISGTTFTTKPDINIEATTMIYNNGYIYVASGNKVNIYEVQSDKTLKNISSYTSSTLTNIVNMSRDKTYLYLSDPSFGYEVVNVETITAPEYFRKSADYKANDTVVFGDSLLIANSEVGEVVI